MSKADELSPDLWDRMAREDLKAAQILADQGLWRHAYEQAGFALEKALKALIMRRRGLNRWPSRQEAPRLHVHQLDVLALEAGLEDELVQLYLNGDDIGLAWMVAKDFSIAYRYPVRGSFPVKRGRDMVRNVGEMGLLTWIISRQR